jgi:uncharacterized protein (DUF2141 family)
MTQPETNTGLLVEFDSVRMRSNLVLVAIYKKGQHLKNFQNCKKWQKYDKISKLRKQNQNFKISKTFKSFHKISKF